VKARVRVRRLVQSVLAAMALLVVAPAIAASKVDPDQRAIAEAIHLREVAQSLRMFRVPLLKQRALSNVALSLDWLEGLGIKVDRSVSIAVDSTREYTLLRKAGTLLRGAKPGSAAYALRREVTLRALELQRTSYGLPKGMLAYTNGEATPTELVINLDDPTFNNPSQFFPLIAHEYRHVHDLARVARLEQIIGQSPAHPNRERLEKKIARLLSRPHAETRAFFAQAFSLGRSGRPLGFWWRAPDGTELDLAYPPAALNKALIKGYFQGLTKTIAAQMRDASPEQKQIAASYLRGYRLALEQQADAFFDAMRKDEARDPEAIQRYNAAAKEILATVEKTLAGSSGGSPLTVEGAFLLGQADAIVAKGPVRVQSLLSSVADPA
jgi:hypothetical protein